MASLYVEPRSLFWYFDQTLTRAIQFQEIYIKQGIEGGKQAAYALRSAVAEYVGSQSGEVEIIAKVCANMSGLARAMRRDGCLDSESELKEFSLGFTQAKASFDFIDVGHGKERADSKIKGTFPAMLPALGWLFGRSRDPRYQPLLGSLVVLGQLLTRLPCAEATRWHLRNYNCRQILLGISHDAGYAPFLDEILQDADTRARVSLIEGFATVRELKNTNVHILDPLPSLFRNQKLVDRSGDRSAESTYFKPTTTSPTLAVSSPASATTPSSSSWAGVTKASPPPQITTPLANKNVNIPIRTASQPKPHTPTWNPGERGIDPPIPINQSALENIKKRTGAAKLCNNHYLRGPCAKGDECCFEHKYRPNADEINAIAHLTRLNPCTSGQECDVENCIYGHHVSCILCFFSGKSPLLTIPQCPSVVGNTCTHPFCKFRITDHPPGTKFKNAKIHEN